MINKLIKAIWDFFCSVKLTIFLLILLASTSIIGTVIPQGNAGIQFVKSLSPFFEKIVLSFQLYDMYDSLWFQIIILFLTLNLIACTLNRFPITLKLHGKEPKPDREKIFENISQDRIIEADIKRADAVDRIRNTISKQFKRTVEKDKGRAHYFYSDKGRYSLFGVYLVHLSVVLILLGAIIGSRYFFGFKGYVSIVEGGSEDSVELTSPPGHEHRDLGFTVHCDRFSVDYYENGMPKEYASEIRFSIDGETVKQGRLRVNHPMTFKGVTFYQSNYGSMPGNYAHITISQNDKDAEPVVFHVVKGKPITLPNRVGELILAEMRDDFMRMGPAALIIIRPFEGDEVQIWLFKNHNMIKHRYPGIFESFAKLNPSIFKPYTFSLGEIELINYTGLQVNKDPGISVVYMGFFVIVAGLFITFFTSHRRVWIKIEENEGKAMVSVAGSSNKNPVGLERELDRLAEQFRNIIKPKRNSYE